MSHQGSSKGFEGKATERGGETDMRPASSPRNAQGGATNPVDSVTILKSSEASSPLESEEGTTRFPQETRNEPEPTNTSSGQGDEETSDDFDLRDPEQMVEVETVIARFVQASRNSLRQDSQRYYCYAFRRFAKNVGLSAYTRRQLAGQTGKQLIIRHLDTIPRNSWRWTLSVIEKVWMNGLDLPWPIDSKRDIGKLPRIRRRLTPKDEIVRTWAVALEHEPDPYYRLVWLLIAEHGWRPSHIRRIKWRNVVYDSAGKPKELYADGSKEGFKTDAPIAARLCPEVSEALTAWSNRLPFLGDENPIIPRRSAKGEIKPAQPLTEDNFRRCWERIRQKWELPKLSPSELRHYAASVVRKIGLSKPASCLLLGHDGGQGDMRSWYDNPDVGELMDEQMVRLPHGVLGTLLLSIEVKDSIPPNALTLVGQYLDGKIGTFEFATKMELIRQQTTIMPEATPTP